jgi:cell division protein FtsL
MTFIEFGKRNNITVPMIVTVTAVFVCSVIAMVFVYQDTITLRHDIEQGQETLSALKVQNAELKNNFYSITDAVAHEAFLQERGLVLENNPHYVQIPSAPMHVILR